MNTEAWWSIVSEYNDAVFPLHILAAALGLVLVYMIYCSPGKKTDLIMKGYLSVICAWNGIVFFLIYGRNLPGTVLGAPLFVGAAILFLWDIKAGKTHFQFADIKWRKYVSLILIVCAFLYPGIGYFLGHVYPEACTFGVMPCPTTVFVLALLVASSPRIDKKVYIVLLVWALPAVGKCFGALDLYEDCILFWSGVYAAVILIKDWKLREGAHE
ncbi:MAG: DUF6064 family protein [Candidatus Methanofastidiosia archaeon]|jgi:hypothetical protein